MACSFSGFESIRFSFVATFKIYRIYATWIEHAGILRNRTEQGQIRETPGTTERVTRSTTETRAGLSSNARW